MKAENAKVVKQRDSMRTKAAILDAAQIAFATRGYGSVGLREIAKDAGIDSALIMRYFGSKELLFRDALKASVNVGRMMAGGHQNFGVRAVETFLDQHSRPNPLPMMILAASDTTARAVALDLLGSDILEPLAAWLGGDDATARATRILMIGTGFFAYFAMLPLQSVANGVDAGTRRWLETSLQAVVDGTDGDASMHTPG